MDEPRLVRDRTPEILSERGRQPVTRRADDGEFLDLLVDRLRIEVEAYADAREVERLADVLDVVDALAEHHGVDREALVAARAERASRKGRFEDRVVLVDVED